MARKPSWELEDQIATIRPDHSEDRKRDGPDGMLATQITPVAYFCDASGEGRTITPEGHDSPADPRLRAGSPKNATRTIRHAKLIESQDQR